MHFSTISTSVLFGAGVVVAAATNLDTKSVSAKVAAVAVSAAAASSCNVGKVYCGWYLADNLGWGSGVPDRNALYLCTSSYNGDWLAHCTNGCSGPTAHCA